MGFILGIIIIVAVIYIISRFSRLIDEGRMNSTQLGWTETYKGRVWEKGDFKIVYDADPEAPKIALYTGTYIRIATLYKNNEEIMHWQGTIDEAVYPAMRYVNRNFY